MFTFALSDKLIDGLFEGVETRTNTDFWITS